MRLLTLLGLLAALVAPAAATALAHSPGDGTLSVKNGEGIVNLDVRGAIIGRFDSGTLVVLAPKEGDCDALQVWGANRERPYLDEDGDAYRCEFVGRNVRFRFVGGKHRIRIGRAQAAARDIDLSVVGRGTGFLRGSSSLQDGHYSLNGEPFQSMPDDGQRVQLAGPSGSPER